MAKKKRVSKSADNWKKKKWFTILATHHFKDAKVGETPALDKEQLIGKKITQSVMALTGEMRKKDTHVTFQIADVKEGTAKTDLVGYEIMPSSVKRMVRRGRDRLDESLLFKSKDGKLVRVKPFVITQTNTSSSIHRVLRHALQSHIRDYLAQNNFDAFASEVITHKLQKEIAISLKKIYPIRTCEIRRFEVVPETRKTHESVIAVKVKPRIPKQPKPAKPQKIEVPQGEQDAAEQELAQEPAASEAAVQEAAAPKQEAAQEPVAKEKSQEAPEQKA